jgi:hypothetical protein
MRAAMRAGVARGQTEFVSPAAGVCLAFMLDLPWFSQPDV